MEKVNVKELQKEVKKQKRLIEYSDELINIQKNHIELISKQLAEQYKTITTFRGLQEETFKSLMSFDIDYVDANKEYDKLKNQSIIKL